LEERFANATYRTNPRVALSVISGQPIPERTSEEREKARSRVNAKRRAENVLMNAQRDRIAAFQAPTHAPSNDNYPQISAKAA